MATYEQQTIDSYTRARREADLDAMGALIDAANKYDSLNPGKNLYQRLIDVAIRMPLNTATG
ncbi:hypothetical protein [Streptomyces sp. CB03911]|uniref:hypothetical protein n=1 Tax=Streptomyces sp. CB03911 TaxID=1804758 RepID=UPI00093D0154|nr:hypothetical protein [Streptomyces sp. CB03911]OKI16606.1 hypothetical protein A6A07_11400 [Streptomyces sp. CB03911]